MLWAGGVPPGQAPGGGLAGCRGVGVPTPGPPPPQLHHRRPPQCPGNGCACPPLPNQCSERLSGSTPDASIVVGPESGRGRVGEMLPPPPPSSPSRRFRLGECLGPGVFPHSPPLPPPLPRPSRRIPLPPSANHASGPHPRRLPCPRAAWRTPLPPIDPVPRVVRTPRTYPAFAQGLPAFAVAPQMPKSRP